MDRDEAQQPPPRCRLPHRAIATGVGWLRSFWFSTPPARAPGVSSAAPRSSALRTLVSRIVFHMKGARRASICSSMSGDIGVDAVDSAEHVRAQELVMVGEMPVERSAQLILLLHYLDRRRLKVRIHGRPRSDRKKRFLLSAVAPSTSTRHPRKARPINWAQRGGLASGREMSLDAEATFHRASCTLGNQVVAASDGVPFRQERRPTRVCRTPVAGSGSATSEPLRLGAGVF